MLNVILVLMLLICALALASLRYTRHVLHPAEIVADWLMFGAASEHWLYVIALLWKRVDIEENLAVMSILILTKVFLMPGLAVWTLYGWFHPRLSKLQKAMAIAWWLILASGAEYALRASGLTTYVRWNQGLMLADISTRFAATLAFAYWYRWLLRREGQLR